MQLKRNEMLNEWTEKKKKIGAILSRMLYLLIMWLINRVEHVRIELIYVSFVSVLMPFILSAKNLSGDFKLSCTNVQFL